jgi:hypothetical protein
MKINKEDLRDAVNKEIISEKQFDALVTLWKNRSRERPGLNVTHFLYYTGGTLALFAMALFISFGWDKFGGMGVMILSSTYAVLTSILMHTQAQLNNTRIAGLFSALTLVMVPLFTFGFQQWMGWLPSTQTGYVEYEHHIKFYWVLTTALTVLFGAILYYVYSLPFIALPLSVSVWYFLSDISQIYFGIGIDMELSTMLSGALILAVTILTEIRRGEARPAAFWWYITGTLSFWAGITLIASSNLFSSSGGDADIEYIGLNWALMLLGLFVRRNVMVITGAIGILSYTTYLFSSVFDDLLVTSGIAVLLGFALIGMGTQWQKHGNNVSRALVKKGPRFLAVWHSD